MGVPPCQLWLTLQSTGCATLSKEAAGLIEAQWKLAVRKWSLRLPTSRTPTWPGALSSLAGAPLASAYDRVEPQKADFAAMEKKLSSSRSSSALARLSTFLS